MNNQGNQTQIALAFPTTTKAADALRTFRHLDASNVLRLVHAAVIVRDANGTRSIHETGDLSPAIKRLIVSVGAAAGFVVGLLWRGMRAGVIGAIFAGQSSAILVTLVDPGFSDLYLEHLADELEAGTSLLVASVEFKTESVASILQSQFAGARTVRPLAPLSEPTALAGSL